MMEFQIRKLIGFLEMQDNYGLEAVFTLEKLIKFKMIRVIHGSSVDFSVAWGLPAKRKSPQPTASLNLKMTKCWDQWEWRCLQKQLHLDQ